MLVLGDKVTLSPLSTRTSLLAAIGCTSRDTEEPHPITIKITRTFNAPSLHYTSIFVHHLTTQVFINVVAKYINT